MKFRESKVRDTTLRVREQASIPRAKGQMTRLRLGERGSPGEQIFVQNGLNYGGLLDTISTAIHLAPMAGV